MFAQPTHLMHRAGGFMGAKNFAKDARRWLLVNIQSEDDFACHALNRDVWRNDMVESIVREGFILFQAVSCFLCLILINCFICNISPRISLDEQLK
jgi:UBX domain-containing protein 7